MARGRGRGGQGNKGRGKRNRGPGKNRRNRVSRTNRRNKVSRKPRGISGSTKKKMAGDRRKKRLSKVTNKSLKSRIKAAGLNKKTETKKKTISASQSRKQVRQNTKDKIATRKKLTLRNALGRLTRPVGAYASNVQGKPKSKLQQQLSNLRKDIAQKSTKEARFKRRADRLKRQFGLDTGDMRNLKINVNVDQAAKHFGLDTNRFTKGLYGALPKAVRNFRFNTELGGKFRSPHKLGVREGYRRPNKGGQTIQANTKKQLQALKPNDKVGGWLDFYNKQTNYDKTKPPIGVGGIQPDDPKKGFVDFYDKQVDNTPPNNLLPLPGAIPGRVRGSMANPSQTIASMYKNILGRAHDQEGLDYWTNEFTSGKQSMDDIRKNIVRSKEFQGRSDADKSAALRGIKQRRAARGEKVGVSRIVEELDRRGIRHSKTDSPRQVPPWFRRGPKTGKPRARRRKAKLQNKATERQYQYDKKAYNLQAKGIKRRMAKSLAAHMAARGV